MPGSLLYRRSVLTGFENQHQKVSQGQKFDPEFFRVSKRRAVALVKVNLPPLMGMRDAALASAEILLKKCAGTPEISLINSVAPAMADMFSEALDVCCKTISMFSNPDTVARETRLLNHIGILTELSAALKDFSLLNARMTEAVTSDAAGDADFDNAYISRLDSRMNNVGRELAAQLYDAYQRYHDRIIRYRSYAVKNLSPENAGRYQQAYDVTVDKYKTVIEKICNNHISISKTRSLSE